MSVHARLVLDDCRTAFAELQTASQDTLRRRWLTTITLLRAVGHVLHKVDGDTSPAWRTAVDTQFAGLKAHRPKPTIFWDFIEEERNNILKLYRFSVRGNLTIGIPGGSTGTTVGPLGTSYASESRFDVSPFVGGPFAGEQPFTVVQQAIDFWENYLGEIERAARA